MTKVSFHKCDQSFTVLKLTLICEYSFIAVPRLTETKPKYRNETELVERNIKIIGKHIQVYRYDVDLPKRPLNDNNLLE